MSDLESIRWLLVPRATALFLHGFLQSNRCKLCVTCLANNYFSPEINKLDYRVPDKLPLDVIDYLANKSPQSNSRTVCFHAFRNQIYLSANSSKLSARPRSFQYLLCLLPGPQITSPRPFLPRPTPSSSPLPSPRIPSS